MRPLAGPYQIISGHNRTAAARRADWRRSRRGLGSTRVPSLRPSWPIFGQDAIEYAHTIKTDAMALLAGFLKESPKHPTGRQKNRSIRRTDFQVTYDHRSRAGTKAGRPEKPGSSREPVSPPKLADLGLTEKESAAVQQIHVLRQEHPKVYGYKSLDQWIWDENANRRHLSKQEMAYAIVAMKEIEEEEKEEAVADLYALHARLPRQGCHRDGSSLRRHRQGAT